MFLAGACWVPAKGRGHQSVCGRRHCGLQPAHSQPEVATALGPLHRSHSVPSLHLLTTHACGPQQRRQNGDHCGHFHGRASELQVHMHVLIFPSPIECFVAVHASNAMSSCCEAGTPVLTSATERCGVYCAGASICSLMLENTADVL